MKRNATLLSLVVWLSVLVYAHSQNVLAFEIFSSLISRSLSFLSLIFVLYVLSSFGVRISSVWISGISRLEMRIIGLGLGLGFLSIAAYCFALIHFLTPICVLIIIFIQSLVGMPELLKDIKLFCSQWASPKGSIKIDIFYLLVMLAFLINYLMSYTPFIDYDSLEYHLAVPKIWMENTGFKLISENIYSNFPMAIETIYSVFMILQREVWIKMLNFAFLFSIAFFVYGWTKRHWSPAIAKWSLVLFYLSTHLGMLSWTGKNDLGLLFFGTLAVLLTIEVVMNSEVDKRQLILVGIFTGLCLSSKYTSLIFYLTPIVLLLIYFHFKRGRSLWSGLGLFVLSVGLVYLPWALKNMVFFSDPFYPLGQKIWTDNLIFQDFWGYHSPKTFSWVGFLTKWIDEIVTGNNFWPLSIILSPLALFFWKDKRVQFLILFTILGYSSWYFFTVRDPRFLISIMPVTAILSALVVEQLFNQIYVKKLVIAFIFVLGLLNLVSLGVAASIYEPISYYFYMQTKDDYLIKQLPPYRAIHYLNKSIRTGKGVLSIGEARSYYFKGPVFAPTVFNESTLKDLLGTLDSKEVLRQLRLRNLGYIFVNYFEIKRLRKSLPQYLSWLDKKRFNFLMDEIAVLNFEDTRNGIRIYRIKDIEQYE